jgi:hypothetical protein
MKNIYKLFTTALMLFISAASIAQTTYQANVKVVRQEQNQWCWDANSKCIMDYYGTVIKQCDIAEYTRTLDNTFGTTPCCTSPTGKCNNPNYLTGNSGIQGIIKHFANISSVSSNGPLADAKITSELGARRPFVIFISWSGGGGHFVVGCNFTGGNLTFMDPWQNNGMTTYKHASGANSIITNTGTGTWGQTLVVTTPFVPTGITDQSVSTEQVTIYPNPSSGEFNIHADNNLKTINVYNVTGQLVNSYSALATNSYSLKIAAAGLYSVQVITENGSAYKKVIVQ